MTDPVVKLAAALRAGQIATHFQPEVSLDTGVLFGFEALARWIHPERGPVPPSEFIPLAEESGLIHDLGRQVLRTACDALATWLAATPERPVRVAVNVSAHQLLDPTFPDAVRETIATSGIPVAGHLGDTAETVSRTYVHWLRDERDVPAKVLDRVLAPAADDWLRTVEV